MQDTWSTRRKRAERGSSKQLLLISERFIGWKSRGESPLFLFSLFPSFSLLLLFPRTKTWAQTVLGYLTLTTVSWRTRMEKLACDSSLSQLTLVHWFRPPSLPGIIALSAISSTTFFTVFFPSFLLRPRSFFLFRFFLLSSFLLTSLIRSLTLKHGRGYIFLPRFRVACNRCRIPL